MDCVIAQDVPDINVGNISNRTPQIAIFDFKAFLNMAMLLAESENAKVLRQIMLECKYRNACDMCTIKEDDICSILQSLTNKGIIKKIGNTYKYILCGV